MMQNYTKKIFVAHRASIGDTLLATPIYRAIKETYPKSKLVVMASHLGREVLQGNPYIDCLVAYEKGDSIFSIINKIWRFDMALILDFHYRSALFAWLAMIPKRIGRGSNKRSFCTDWVNAEHMGSTFEPIKFLEIAKSINVLTKNINIVGPTCLEQEKNCVVKMVAKIRKDSGKKKLVLLAPYSLASLKDWPTENYQKLISFLQTNNCIVAIIGGKENQEKADIEFPSAINWVGDTNLRETMLLIGEADLLICGCTSVLHLASLTNTPQIAIYGPTDPIQWAPKQNCTVITHNFPCSPCYTKGINCEDNRCIKDIKPSEVYEKVIETLKISIKKELTFINESEKQIL